MNQTNQTFDFNFNNFVNGKSGYLCAVKVDSYTEYRAFKGITVNFGNVVVSPSHVPANDLQDIILTFDGAPFLAGSRVSFATLSANCADLTTALPNPLQFTPLVPMGITGQYMTVNFSQVETSGSTPLKMCVITVADPDGGPGVYMISVDLVLVSAVVSMAGDPHVRSSTGEWTDFHGETGVYTLYRGLDLEANAKLGYAIRDQFMIWHPKVMRPGTMIEEVGLKLLEAGIHIRLGVYGGGMVSVREALKPTVFLTAHDSRSLQLGDYTLVWAPCEESCTAALPWGTHERSHVLTVRGKHEFMKLSVASSGGYRFVDVEALPMQGSTGLLADASHSPATLWDALRAGGEAAYKVEAPFSI